MPAILCSYKDTRIKIDDILYTLLLLLLLF